MQSSLKGKETRAKDKYIWERDSELSAVKKLVAIYSDAVTLKDTEFRKKYPNDLGIELVDKLLDLYARVYNIKSLRTKNAGEIKALTASIHQLEKDLIPEEVYIKKNAVQARPQEPVYMTVPECPKPIVLLEIIEPKKPVEPEGYGAISDKLSENEQCKEVLRKKTGIISSITKKYFDKLKPEIEEIAKKLHLDLTVEITKNMSIGYTYNGVKMDSFSSGEQTAVNIAVSLAYSYLECDVLFIDEELDTLDKENFVAVQSVLKAAITELGIRAFVIISHRELDNMDGRITL
ncbi:hypothetical protein FACS1894211_02350 [Clostridia bacterium]|nr:hypothetical protein FACS1894211_02350 [Clostridia bacterium]